MLIGQNTKATGNNWSLAVICRPGPLFTDVPSDVRKTFFFNMHSTI